MNHHRILILLALFGLQSLALPAFSQTPPALTDSVEVSSKNQRTALNRQAGRMKAEVTVSIRNKGDRPLEALLYAVIRFATASGGNLSGLTVTGLSGGPDQAPWNTWYRELAAPGQPPLPAGAATEFQFSYEYPAGLIVSYTTAVHGVRNADPVASIGGPYSGQQGTPLVFNAAASSDPDGDALTCAWDFGDGTTGEGANPQHAYPVPGIYTVSVAVSDSRGGLSTRETEVPVAPSGVFALARTRTLDGNGHPLGGVSVTETGPDGSATRESDSLTGFLPLGGSPGTYTWRFSRDGWLDLVAPFGAQ